jgi:hypothetical protein
MQDDLKKKEVFKNILGLIPGEKLPYSDDLTYFNIDPLLPDFKPRHKYIDKLNQAKLRLEQKRDEDIKAAIKLIEDQYSVLIIPIDYGIKKLEAIIFLKEKCDMVILEDGKVK